MKKVLVTILLFISLFIFFPNKVKADTIEEIDVNAKMVELAKKARANSNYCYNYLSTFEKGEIYQRYYDYLFDLNCDFMLGKFEPGKILDQIDKNHYVSFEYSFIIDPSEYLKPGEYLNDKEYRNLNYMFHWDNPIFYWMHPYYYMCNNRDYALDDKIYVLIDFRDRHYNSFEDRTKINEEIYDEINRYLLLVEGVDSPYTKARIFQNEIALNLTYEYVDGAYSNRNYAHNILGVFKYNWGVCESYAQTFQFLLNLSGVECIQVHGQKHAWNMAKMNDGQWYYFDLTNDDTDNPNSPVVFGEFCTINESFLNNHKPYEAYNYNLLTGEFFKIPQHADGNSNVSDFYTYKYEGVTYKIYYDKAIPIHKDDASTKLLETLELYNQTYTITCYHNEKIEYNNCYACQMCLKEMHDIVYQKEKPATCTEDGITSGNYCSNCNKILKGCEVVDALGHIDSGWIVDIIATDSNAGHRYRECLECEEILEEEVIPKLGKDGFNYIYLIPMLVAVIIPCGTIIFVIKKKKQN